MTAFIHMCNVQTFETSLEFSWIWMDGKRSKRGYGNIHSRAYWLHVLRFWPISDRVATT